MVKLGFIEVNLKEVTKHDEYVGEPGSNWFQHTHTILKTAFLAFTAMSPTESRNWGPWLTFWELHLALFNPGLERDHLEPWYGHLPCTDYCYFLQTLLPCSVMRGCQAVLITLWTLDIGCWPLLCWEPRHKARFISSVLAPTCFLIPLFQSTKGQYPFWSKLSKSLQP